MRTNIDETERELASSLRTLRASLPDGIAADIAMAEVETFCCIALAVMKKTNPSKLRSETRTFEIKCRMDGIPVLRGAA